MPGAAESAQEQAAVQAFLLVLFLFLTFCLVVAGVERVAFKLKSMLVGLVGRQTFNTFVIALILIYSGCGAYKSATTVQHPFTVLFLGAAHTTRHLRTSVELVHHGRFHLPALFLGRGVLSAGRGGGATPEFVSARLPCAGPVGLEGRILRRRLAAQACQTRQLRQPARGGFSVRLRSLGRRGSRLYRCWGALHLDRLIRSPLQATSMRQ